MLPEQHDILWTFMTMMFTLFAGFAFGNVVKHCRENEGVNTKLWGGIFGILFLVCFWETVHMFSLAQGDQISFFFEKQVLTIFVILLAWGIFFKILEKGCVNSVFIFR